MAPEKKEPDKKEPDKQEEDLVERNRKAWDQWSKADGPWSQPVTAEIIEAARRGEWSVKLTNTLAVPSQWFPKLEGCRVLCLAGSGGQQAPVFAAAGAQVTVLDFSGEQLEKDRRVAEREGLEIELVQGDMRDLSKFGDGAFELVFHPASNCYVPEVEPVWREAFRVLEAGGRLLSGFMNPVHYLFTDAANYDQAEPLEVRYKIPFSSERDGASAEREARARNQEPVEFGHSLDSLIGAQIGAGFVITGFYEDVYPETALAAFHPSLIATCALKPEAAPRLARAGNMARE